MATTDTTRGASSGATPPRGRGGVVDLSISESPEYAGRAIAALADDPDVVRKSGRAFRVGELAREYGLTDVDGRQVPPFTIPDAEAAPNAGASAGAEAGAAAGAAAPDEALAANH